MTRTHPTATTAVCERIHARARHTESPSRLTGRHLSVEHRRRPGDEVAGATLTPVAMPCVCCTGGVSRHLAGSMPPATAGAAANTILRVLRTGAAELPPAG